MTRTFSKSIDKLNVVNTLGLNSNVVYEVGWYYIIRDDVFDTERNLYYETQLDISNIESFINYESLTEEQIIEWIETTISEEKNIEIQQELNRMIDILNGGMNNQKSLPWSQ